VLRELHLLCGAASSRKGLILKGYDDSVNAPRGAAANVAENEAFVNKQSHRRKYIS
jgi:hypothetical protein